MTQKGIEEKTALVTGATGFIGSNLTRALLEKGYSVTCLVRSTSNTRLIQNLPVRTVVGDLDNPAAIREAALGNETVFHIAGLTKAKDREQFHHVNRTGTLNLLTILSEMDSPPRRFIFASSLAAAGPGNCETPLTENDEPHPVSWYGDSKLASEKEVLKFAHLYPVTILRPSAVYGPGEQDIYLIFRMIRKGYLLLPGRLSRCFSLVHVYDVADAFIQAGETNTPSGEIFFISHPEIQNWHTVSTAISQEMRTRFHTIPLPGWLALAAGTAGEIYSLITNKTTALNRQKVRELLQPAWTCDISKAQNILNFCPKIDLAGGVRETLRWYEQEGWL